MIGDVQYLIGVQEAREAGVVAGAPRRSGRSSAARCGRVEREQVPEDGELGARVVHEQRLELRLDRVQLALERAEAAHQLRERRLHERPLAHVLVQRREHLIHVYANTAHIVTGLLLMCNSYNVHYGAKAKEYVRTGYRIVGAQNGEAARTGREEERLDFHAVLVGGQRKQPRVFALLSGGRLRALHQQSANHSVEEVLVGGHAVGADRRVEFLCARVYMTRIRTFVDRMNISHEISDKMYEEGVELLAQIDERVLEALVALVAEESRGEQPQDGELADVGRRQRALEDEQRIRNVQLRHQLVHRNQLVLLGLYSI